jgi:O-antigen ligase
MVLPFLFKIRTQEKKVLRRLFLGICLLACVLGIFLSLSRGGVVAMILELVMLILGTWKGWKRIVLVSDMIMFGVAAIGYQWAKRAENQGSNYTAEDAESSRMELWKAGGNMVKAHPFLGVGSLSFGEHARDYGELSGDQIGKNSHNTYIEVVATSGILGFVAFLMMLRGMIKTLRQKLTRPGHEWLEAARSATLISLWSIMLRALLDAKPHDWSFYVLCSIAISYGALRAAIEKSEAGAGDPVAEAPRPRFVAGGRFVRPGFTR